MSCADNRTALGAYILGALDVDEHQQVREHLASCAECRAEYDELAGIPALLATVTPEQAEQAASHPLVTPSETGLHQLLGRMRDERAAEQATEQASQRARGRKRGGLMLAAAAVFLVLAVGGGFVGGSQLASDDGGFGGPPIGQTVALEGENEAAGVRVSAEVTPYGWGTRVTMVMNGVQPGEICDFRIYDEYGREWGAGSWEVTEGHAKDVEWFGDVGVPMDHIARVELWEGSSDKRLVSWKL